MAYITLDQLKSRLGDTLYKRLTDRVAGATANDTVGQEIVDHAGAEVDSKLSRRFATPLDLGLHAELAPLLSLRTLDIAELLSWRSSPFVADVPERIRLAYIEAHAWLDRLADGRVELPSLGTPAPRAAAGPRVTATPRVMTAEEMDGL